MTTPGVEESKTGTIPSAEEQAKVTSEAKGKTPRDASKVSPKEAPKLYSQKEADAIAHAARSEGGRNWKTLETERDNLKGQVQTITSEIEDNKSEMEKLQSKLDDLANDDPARFDAIKELKAAQEERRQLKVRERTLEGKEQAYGERIKKAESLETEVLILQVVEDYEGADGDRLSNMCSTLNITSEEQIRKVAETLWTKKSEPTTPSVLPLTGVTDGGQEDLSNLSPKEKIDKGLDKLRKK